MIEVLKFKKDIYPKEAIIKTAYHFIERAYIFLNHDNENYIIELTLKENQNSKDIENEFKNELLAQTTRQVIIKQTKQIREMILARAFASTIVNTDDQIRFDDTDDEETDMGDIMDDWFKTFG